MKIVDKYGLAEQPYGTVFYNIDKWGNIVAGPKVLISHSWVSSFDGKPMFNGVLYLEPSDMHELSTDLKIGTEVNLSQLGDDDMWFAVDEDSNDYDDSDRFLVLSKEEAVDLIKTMIRVTGTKNTLE